jgi:hypothetical protein
MFHPVGRVLRADNVVRPNDVLLAQQYPAAGKPFDERPVNCRVDVARQDDQIVRSRRQHRAGIVFQVCLEPAHLHSLYCGVLPGALEADRRNIDRIDPPAVCCKIQTVSSGSAGDVEGAALRQL